MEEQLYQAIKDGSLQRVMDIVAKYKIADVVNNILNHNRQTPYLMAAEKGQVGMYDYFASLPHFDVNAKDKSDLNALALATLFGREQMFDHLVKKYNFRFDLDGLLMSPLKYAARSNNKKMVEHLISHYTLFVDDDLINSAQPELAEYLRKIDRLNDELNAEIDRGNLTNFRKLCEEKGAKPQSAKNNLAEKAALTGAIDIFEYLVDEQNFTNFDRKFLGEEALFKNTPQLLESLLFKQDLNPELGLYEFCNARHFNNEASRYLKDIRTSNERFIQAVESNVTELTIGENILKSSINKAALYCASVGNLELYKLISGHEKFDKNTLDQDLLHRAAISGNIEFVEHLTNAPNFSFDKKILASVLKNCPQEKKLEMASYLIRKDVGFLFEDYSDILGDQSEEIKNLVTQASAAVREVSDIFADKNLRGKSEAEIISLFEELKTITENPYKIARFNSSNVIQALTNRGFTELYKKIATNEPELRIDYKDNALEFFNAAEKSKNFTLFECALENFGDSSQVYKLQFVKRNTRAREYLDGLINSGKVVLKRYSQEEIISCILPTDNDLKRWKSKDPQVFYSFQTPPEHDVLPFSKEEQKFFNSVVEEASRDLIVPIEEIRLNKAELEAVVKNKFDKNVFFLTKNHIDGNAVYPDTAPHENRNEVAYKLIILPVGEILNRKYMALHQLAIGVGDAKHPSYYGSSIDIEPNCDLGVTTAHTIMSHICGSGSYSEDCVNVARYSTKDQFAEIVRFREADVTAITRSLVKQYPQLADKVDEFNHERATCPADYQFSGAQLAFAAIFFAGAVKYLIDRFARPRGAVAQRGAAAVVTGDDRQQH